VTAPLRAFRVGIVGARRVRQGTGPFLAGFLHAAGTKVVGVCGTTPETAEAAAADLRARFGIVATAHTDAAGMARRERLDALAIATPADTHLGFLDVALRNRLHALCEKPLVYHAGDFAADAARIVESFERQATCLSVASPWRHALGTYLQLFPDVRPREATSFEMRLSPSATGEATLPDSMPHALAVLDHLFPAPGADLREVAFEVASPGDVLVRFVHPGGRAGVACRVRLVTCPDAPRPLSFGFEGQVGHRVIREPGYRLSLRAGPEEGAREVALPDPLDACVKDFVARVRRGAPFPPDPTVLPGARRLRQLVLAWRDGPARVVGGPAAV
jgi:predicted dehydrogenase